MGILKEIKANEGQKITEEKLKSLYMGKTEIEMQGKYKQWVVDELFNEEE